MSETVWIAIATILATFIAALVSTWVQVKAMRAIANPEQKPPKPTMKIKGKVKYFIKTYGADALSLIFPVLGLALGFSLPFNKWALVGIIINSVFFTHNLFYLTLSVRLFPMLDRRDELLDRMIKTLEQGSDVSKEVLKTNRDLVDTCHDLTVLLNAALKSKRQRKTPKTEK